MYTQLEQYYIIHYVHIYIEKNDISNFLQSRSINYHKIVKLFKSNSVCQNWIRLFILIPFRK